jgi:hypothetical protein
MADYAQAPVRQKVISEKRDEVGRLRLDRRCQHLARAVEGDLAQRIKD